MGSEMCIRDRVNLREPWRCRFYRRGVDLSGIIFVVLAVAWAVYLIPKALKHHDEVARTRSIDRFSSAMRVLARREPVNRRDARLVVTPARAAGNPRVLAPTRPASAVETGVTEGTDSPGVETQVEVSVRPAVPRARIVARRKAARAAARRRRLLLTVLLLCTAVTAGVAAFGLAPWWSVAIPAGLTLVYLLLCRTQVRRESLHDFDLLDQRPAQEDEATLVPRRAVEAEEGEPAAAEVAQVAVAVGHVDEFGVAEFDDTEDTVGIEVALLDAIMIPTEDGGSLWDPLPVTLPTYVTKPKARRTVRTIDLGEPGTWTSGRTAEDTEIVARAEAEQAETKAAGEGDQQRAVGS